MTENKKEWSEPELIVLVRSKPEEAVLISCKAGADTLGSVVLATGCGNPGGGYCGECAGIVAS